MKDANRLAHLVRSCLDAEASVMARTFMVRLLTAQRGVEAMNMNVGVRVRVATGTGQDYGLAAIAALARAQGLADGNRNWQIGESELGRF